MYAIAPHHSFLFLGSWKAKAKLSTLNANKIHNQFLLSNGFCPAWSFKTACSCAALAFPSMIPHLRSLYMWTNQAVVDPPTLLLHSCTIAPGCLVTPAGISTSPMQGQRQLFHGLYSILEASRQQPHSSCKDIEKQSKTLPCHHLCQLDCPRQLWMLHGHLSLALSPFQSFLEAHVHAREEKPASHATLFLSLELPTLQQNLAENRGAGCSR